MRIDFYRFQCFSIGYPYDVCKRTLAEAKKAYRQMKFKGYRLNSAITVAQEPMTASSFPILCGMKMNTALDGQPLPIWARSI